MLSNPIMRFLLWLWMGLCWLDVILAGLTGAGVPGLALIWGVFLTIVMVGTSKLGRRMLS